jgi:hypothetical protein
MFIPSCTERFRLAGSREQIHDAVITYTCLNNRLETEVEAEVRKDGRQVAQASPYLVLGQAPEPSGFKVVAILIPLL